MLEKILTFTGDFGEKIAMKYTSLPTRVAKIISLPLYLVIIIPWVTIMILLMAMYMLEGKIKYDIGITEDLAVIKEGVIEAWHDLQ